MTKRMAVVKHIVQRRKCFAFLEAVTVPELTVGKKFKVIAFNLNIWGP